MKTQRFNVVSKMHLILLAIPAMLMLLSGCAKDEVLILSDLADQAKVDQVQVDETTANKKASKVYTLAELAVPGISGTATLIDMPQGARVVIKLDNTPNGGAHPAHIHFNDAATGGGIAISLNDVKGSSGYSKTFVTEMNDGTPISYQDLLSFDGYINVHLSSSDLGTIVAQGNIGSNAP